MKIPFYCVMDLITYRIYRWMNGIRLMVKMIMPRNYIILFCAILLLLIAQLLSSGSASNAQSLKKNPPSQAEMQLSFAPLVKQTANAVVNVYAERMVRQRSPFAGDPFFEQFFGQKFSNRTEKQSSLGSGVVIDSSGIVITNHHVIQSADDIKVAFSDGREYSSRILLQDKSVDLAILQIEGGRGFAALEFGDSDALEVGDLVLAIGNPFGVGQTVTSGIISALARNQVGVSDFGFFIQTDAAINPGNSGGALVDMNGKLIGINTAIFSRSGGSNGIGFAIPANMVRAVTTAAIGGNDKFVRPFIGASFDPITSDIAEALGLNVAKGALVTAIVPDGPAERAGLKVGDLVFGFNGQAVEHPDALGYRLSTSLVGDIIELSIRTRGENKGLKIKLEAPPAGGVFNTSILEGNNPFAGAEVALLTPFLANEMKIPSNIKGIAILKIERGALAGRYGFRAGDIITSVSNRELESVAQLEEILSAGASFWRLEIIRNGQRIRQVLR